MLNSASTIYLAGEWWRWMISMGWQVALLFSIVWAATLMLRKSSASLRYALWLLVFVKLVLPPTLATPWSVGNILPHSELSAVADPGLFAEPDGEPASGQASDSGSAMPAAPFSLNKLQVAAVMWAVGFCVLLVFMSAQARRYRRRVLRNAVPADARHLAGIENLCWQMGIRRRPLLLINDSIKTPAVFGLWNPTIALPASLSEGLSERQFTNVLAHELAHIGRHDIEMGWVISIVTCCYWFNPIVWVANFFLRREREMASDDAVLYATKQEGKEYSATLLRVAETFDNSVPVGAGFMGMLELSDNLIARVVSTLDATRARRFGWVSATAILVLLAMVLPMGSWNPVAAAAEGEPPPQIVSSAPAMGATDVDPALQQIEVNFDRDMATSFSWTGGSPNFPQTTGKAQWVTPRKCVLPVKLEEGKYYRIGINSKSHRNFKSADGVPVKPQALTFTTRGAAADLVGALNPPHVVSMSPENGAAKVSPAVDKLTVTFDKPMGDGFSWTGGGETFPEAKGTPEWSADLKTCTLSVTLKPNHEYEFGLNSRNHNNFQSSYGVPLEPVMWKFKTGEK